MSTIILSLLEALLGRYYRNSTSQPLTFFSFGINSFVDSDNSFSQSKQETPWYDCTIRWINIIKDLASAIVAVAAVYHIFFGH
jgi:hypothetical protein